MAIYGSSIAGFGARPDLEPYLAGGREVVGTDDHCDEHPRRGRILPDYGETVMWPDDLKSQEVLVEL